ncbi:MAG: sialate O-acetylesterase [Akkermansiaceae bacterium]
MNFLRLITLFSLTLSLNLRAEKVAKEDLHIYLLIGQSNMAGRAPVDETKADPIEGVLLLNAKNEWEVAKNPLNRYSTIRKGLGMQKLNPGYSFAKAMKKNHPKATLGLVVNAKGGSSIEQWATDKKFYKDIITRAKVAQKTGTLEGILWHQGESNSSRAEIYPSQLKALVENLRKDLETPKLPFVAGEIKEGEKINAEIAKLPDHVPYTAVASSKGLKTMDRWHFDAPSMIALGERYAEEILKLQGE